MEKIIQKGKLSDFRKKSKGSDLKTPDERMAAMSLICKSRTEDGHVERRFKRAVGRPKDQIDLLELEKQ